MSSAGGRGLGGRMLTSSVMLQKENTVDVVGGLGTQGEALWAERLDAGWRL